jgi:hypothetical protein
LLQGDAREPAGAWERRETLSIKLIPIAEHYRISIGRLADPSAPAELPATDPATAPRWSTVRWKTSGNYLSKIEKQGERLLLDEL